MLDSITATQPPDMPVDDDLQQIMGLLSGEPEKAEVTAEPEKEQSAGDDPPPEKEEVTDEEQAEDAKLDYGMKVPITGSEPVTLGELKDAWQNKQAAMLELTDRENAVLRETEKAQTLLSYIDQLPPHIADAAKAQAATDYQREMQALVTILPEAKTPEGIRHIRDGLYALAEEYGLSKRDVDGVKHAVTIKMMHDFARLKQSIREAKQNVKPLRSDTPKAAQDSINTNATQALIAKAKQSRNVSDEVAAIDALLRSA